MEEKKIKSIIVSKDVFDALVEHSKLVPDGPCDALATIQRAGSINGIPVYRDPFLPPNKVLYTYTLGSTISPDLLRLVVPDEEGWIPLSERDMVE